MCEFESHQPYCRYRNMKLDGWTRELDRHHMDGPREILWKNGTGFFDLILIEPQPASQSEAYILNLRKLCINEKVFNMGYAWTHFFQTHFAANNIDEAKEKAIVYLEKFQSFINTLE